MPPPAQIWDDNSAWPIDWRYRWADSASSRDMLTWSRDVVGPPAPLPPAPAIPAVVATGRHDDACRTSDCIHRCALPPPPTRPVAFVAFVVDGDIDDVIPPITIPANGGTLLTWLVLAVVEDDDGKLASSRAGGEGCAAYPPPLDDERRFDLLFPMMMIYFLLRWVYVMVRV